MSAAWRTELERLETMRQALIRRLSSGATTPEYEIEAWRDSGVKMCEHVEAGGLGYCFGPKCWPCILKESEQSFLPEEK